MQSLQQKKLIKFLVFILGCILNLVINKIHKSFINFPVTTDLLCFNGNKNAYKVYFSILCMEITTIKLEKETKKRLDKLKVHKRESYDDVLQKILGISKCLSYQSLQS